MILCIVNETVLKCFQALQFLRSDVTTTKLSTSGVSEKVIAIRADKFEEKCIEMDCTPIKATDLRASVQAFGLGEMIIPSFLLTLSYYLIF